MIELLSRQTASAALAGCNLGHGVRSIVGNPDTSPDIRDGVWGTEAILGARQYRNERTGRDIELRDRVPRAHRCAEIRDPHVFGARGDRRHDVESVLLALDESNEGACFGVDFGK